VDIATHSVMYGIDELSVYDPWSMLKGEQQNICARVEKRVARLQSNQKVKPVPLQLSVNGEQSHKNTSLNLHINFLGAEDGRGSLVRAARDLCSSGVRSEDVTVQLIGDSLRRLSVSEPELLLIFGAVDSLAGYPPWALRVTEFVSMPNRRQMTEFEFVECLEQLSGRDQRFGR
jgi:undecaprenyl pyrophosphate synthase